MSKCDNCLARDFFAKVFDLHWTGADDCPVDVCPMECKEAEDEGNEVIP